MKIGNKKWEKIISSDPMCLVVGKGNEKWRKKKKEILLS